jgi:glutathione S-transferase
MNLRTWCVTADLPAPTRDQIARIEGLWKSLRERFSSRGPWLFGIRTVADAFYLPVATRFRAYAIGLSGPAHAYAQTCLADPDFMNWERDAANEAAVPFSRANLDGLYAASRP